MSLLVEGKVALVTGAAGGIGLSFVQELLRNGAKGVVLVDIYIYILLQTAKEQIANEFGVAKVDFIKADVADKNHFEAAFKKAIQTFNQLDIVINNAGVGDDVNYEREIQINCNAVVHGTLLAVHEYLPKYRSEKEGYVVNISSKCAIDPSRGLPIYTGSKFFVDGFSRAIGAEVHYEKTKVKVLTICPGLTNTNILKIAKCLGPEYREIFENDNAGCQQQDPNHLGKELINILNRESGTVWVVDNCKPAVKVN